MKQQPFTFQPRFEKLLRLQADAPKQFALLCPAVKQSVGAYERARERYMLKRLESKQAA